MSSKEKIQVIDLKEDGSFVIEDMPEEQHLVKANSHSLVPEKRQRDITRPRQRRGKVADGTFG